MRAHIHAHVYADDPFPPLAPGKLRLYNMRFCPWGQRTVLALALKGIPYVWREPAQTKTIAGARW